jgi:hypothetical protein
MLALIVWYKKRALGKRGKRERRLVSRRLRLELIETTKRINAATTAYYPHRKLKQEANCYQGSTPHIAPAVSSSKKQALIKGAHHIVPAKSKHTYPVFKYAQISWSVQSLDNNKKWKAASSAPLSSASLSSAPLSSAPLSSAPLSSAPLYVVSATRRTNFWRVATLSTFSTRTVVG